MLNKTKMLQWIFCLGIGAVMCACFAGETSSVMLFWGITATSVAIMAFELLPMVIVGLLLPAAYIVGGTSSGAVAFGPWLTVVPWIVLAGMIIGRLMDKTGLSRRIALLIISSVGKNTLMLMVALAITGYVTGLLVPDTFTTVVLTVTLTTALCERLGIEKRSNEAGVLMFAGFFAGMVPHTMYFPNGLGIIAAEMVKSTGLEFSWLSFAYDNIIPTMLLSAASILVLLPFCTTKIHGIVSSAASIARNDVEEMGPMTGMEKRALILLILGLVAFIAERWHGITGAYAFLFVILFAFTPIFNLLDEDDLGHVPFGLLFFITGCMTIGFVAGELKIADWIAEIVTPMFASFGSAGTLSLVSFFTGFFVNFILTPLAAVASLSLPLMEVCIELGIPLKPVLYSFLYGLEHVLLPYEAAPILYMYATGYVSLRFFVIIMALRTLAGGAVMAISAWGIWPYIL